MRRGAVVAGLIGLSLLVSCGFGGTQAVILHIPLRVVADPPVSRWHCITKNPSKVSYGLRVTNLSGSAVNVAQCQLNAIGANGKMPDQIQNLLLVVGLRRRGVRAAAVGAGEHAELQPRSNPARRTTRQAVSY